MAHATTPALQFPTPLGVPLEAAFDAGRLTSDGGLPWLAEADQALGLVDALAACIPEWRRGPVRHSLATLLRQRLYQIACGYADQNDATTLRTDPLLKLVCGRRPLTGAELASQPTLSRLENAVDRHTIEALAAALVECYVRARGERGAPRRIVLDFGRHGRPRARAAGRRRLPWILPPAHVPSPAGLRWRDRPPHHRRATPGALPWQPVGGARAAPPGPPLAPGLAASGHRAACGQWLRHPPAVCLVRGPPRELHHRPHPQPRLGAARRPLTRPGPSHQRPAGWGQGALRRGRALPGRQLAASPPSGLQGRSPRQGPEHALRGDYPPRRPPAALRLYVRRGQPENWVKELKNALPADRLSDHRFWANAFRLLLHAAAYWLLDTLRRWLAGTAAATYQFDTLRLQLLKVGGRVRELADRVRLHLASSHPGEPWWAHLATRFRPPVNNPG